ncbi:MAG: hypothetical protein J1F01_06030 [Oscillospiraceae bacterium]|nr:hypothetical protein [Oscillospiraceae bacterium]
MLRIDANWQTDLLRKEYTSVFFILLADLRSDHTSPVCLLVAAAVLPCHSASLHDVTPVRSYGVATSLREVA